MDNPIEAQNLSGAVGFTGTSGDSMSREESRKVEVKFHHHLLNNIAEVDSEFLSHYHALDSLAEKEIIGWTFNQLLENKFLRKFWKGDKWAQLALRQGVFWDVWSLHPEGINFTFNVMIQYAPKDENWDAYLQSISQLTTDQKYRLYEIFYYKDSEYFEKLGLAGVKYIAERASIAHLFFWTRLVVENTQDQDDLKRFIRKIFHHVLSRMQAIPYDLYEDNSETVGELELVPVYRAIEIYTSLGVKVPRPIFYPFMEKILLPEVLEKLQPLFED